MFNWRKITIEDYPMLKDWWDDWKWPEAPLPEMLPSSGVLVYTDVPVYAGFLYETGTVIGWVEYVVSNKKAPIIDRRGALEYLMTVLGVLAKDRGIKLLLTTTNNSSFVNSLTKIGFDKGDQDLVQLVKML